MHVTDVVALEQFHSALHPHFHALNSLPIHCELLQKMSANPCSTLAIVKMLAITGPPILHFILHDFPLMTALWDSEHMPGCFRRIYWNCSKLLCMASRLIPDEWCFSLQFGNSPRMLGTELRKTFFFFKSGKNIAALPLCCHPAAWRVDNSGHR